MPDLSFPPDSERMAQAMRRVGALQIALCEHLLRDKPESICDH